MKKQWTLLHKTFQLFVRMLFEQSEETDGEQTMELQPMVIEDSMESQKNSSSCSNKKGFSVWESCKNVMKELGSSSTVASQSTNGEKMTTDYLNEPPLEGPKLIL